MTSTHGTSAPPPGSAADPVAPREFARDEEALFSTIMSISADAVITVDETQTILHFNQGAEQIFGYHPSEIIGRRLEELLPHRFRASHAEHVTGFGVGEAMARRMGHRREIFGLRKNGEEFPAEASIAKVDVGGRRVYSAVLRDVSDRKRAEQEQRFLAAASAVLASSLDYEATIEAVANLTVPALAEWCTLELVEPDGTFRRVTAPHANRERQWALDALAERFSSDVDSPWPTADVVRTGRAELVPAVTEDWLEARTVNEAHRELLRAAGIATLIIVPLVARHEMLGALTLARGPGVRAFDAAEEALARDLGLRAALAIDSARLYRTARRATLARDEVLGVVSHDLRNPLSAIAMCARALQESPPTADAERDYLLDAISDSTEWMKRLIQDLLDVASIEAGRLSIERRPEEVAPIVQRTLAMFDRAAAERGVTLEAHVEESLPAVFGDAGRVLQVLANLVGNALKFTEPGGRVDLTVRSRDRGVEFSVRDTGPGIPTEHLPHLFELYWHASVTTRSRGSGYGLAIAKGIVDAHDGRIWVESTVGEGSAFFFSLPASAD